jgi:hypothetical protein
VRDNAALNRRVEVRAGQTIEIDTYRIRILEVNDKESVTLAITSQ